jgi:peptidoglycan/xylan/chitin deacetylase (PgdA/CDA1 family)
VFPADVVHVEVFGNLASSSAFMLGLSPADVPADKLSPVDATHPLICGLRAVKPNVDERRPNLVVQSKARPHPGAVLLYHRIGARQPDTHDLATDLPSFRNHLAYLRDRCVPMPLEELAAGAAASSLPRGAVALTFDDGYLEHLTVVAPLLAEYGVPATFFVTTDRLDESHESWWDTLERVFTSAVPLPGNLDLYGDGSFVRTTASTEDRAAVHRELGRVLYRESADRRADALRRIVDWSGVVDLAPRQSHRLLTADEIRLLARMPGCDVGAHSVNHLCLSLQPPSTQADEVGSCKITLERLLGTPIRTFAYPYGGLTETTALLVRDAGFSIGATVSCGAVSAGTRFLEMPRLEVGGFNAPSVVGRLEMCFDA